MYDLIIIGGGPAGLAASIYSTRYHLKTLVLGMEIGGMITKAVSIENYPGFKKTSGIELMDKFEEHAESLGIKIKEEEVISAKKSKDMFIVKTSKKEYESKALIIAAGTEKRKLNAKGEEKFIGKGVSYCSTCDAPLYKDMTIGVVGGCDSAVWAALLAAEYAKKVIMIYRGCELRAQPINKEKVMNNKKIEIIYNANVVEVAGKQFLEEIKLDNGKTLKLDGLFIEIGSEPSNKIAKELNVNLNEKGEIIVNKKAETNVEGIFAAGDVTDAFLKQVITASAEGAIAAFSAYNYLKSKK